MGGKEGRGRGSAAQRSITFLLPYPFIGSLLSYCEAVLHAMFFSTFVMEHASLFTVCQAPCHL